MTLKDYQFGMIYRFVYSLEVPKSRPRWLDRRLALVLAMVLGLEILGLYIATPSEINVYGNGDFAGSSQMILVLLGLAVILGLAYGFVAAMSLDENVVAASQSQWAARARNFVSRIANLLYEFASNSFNVLLVGLTPVIDWRQHARELLPHLTSHCWPTGNTPHLIYEPVA